MQSHSKLFIAHKGLLSIALGLMSTLGCASFSGPSLPPTKSKSGIESHIRKHEKQASGQKNKIAIAKKIARFKELLAHGGPKSAAEWKLHDELLATYSALKEEQTLGLDQITVPANTKVTLSLPSFCLNSSLASPEENERFRWRKGDPGIPYFKEILGYIARHSEKQDLIQELLWNLGNKTRWEEYPERHRRILETIDPQASSRLPSQIKDSLRNAATNFLSDALPGLETVRDAVSLVEGEYYTFDQIRRDLENRKSSESLAFDPEMLEGIPDTSQYVDIRSSGFSRQTVTFYNPTADAVSISLSDYYLESTRSDVQRIGLFSPANGDTDLLRSLEELLYGQMLRLGIGFVPGLNDVADAYELFVGHDFVTGEKLSPQERALSGLGLIVGSGSGYRYAERVINAPPKYMGAFERGLEHAGARQGIQIQSEGATAALKDAKNSVSVRERLGKVRDYPAEKANRAFAERGSFPPYKRGTQVKEFRSTQGDRWVRVHGPRNQNGAWMIRKEAVAGLTPEQIRIRYSLPSTPTEVSDVILPAGTLIRRGRVEGNFGGSSGALQYEILESKQSYDWFQRRRGIDDI